MSRIHPKTARERIGLTQEAAADAAGLSQPALSRIESGESKSPRFDTVLKLAKLYRVAPEALRFGPPRRSARVA